MCSGRSLSSSSSDTRLFVSSAETLDDKKQALGKIQALKKVSQKEQQQQKQQQQQRLKKKYKRKRPKPPTEQQSDAMRKSWKKDFEELKQHQASESPMSIWSFESLFPEAVLDEATIEKDLYGIRDRDKKLVNDKQKKRKKTTTTTTTSKQKVKSSSIGGSSVMRVWREPRSASSSTTPQPPSERFNGVGRLMDKTNKDCSLAVDDDFLDMLGNSTVTSADWAQDGGGGGGGVVNATVNPAMTRMVEDRVYGFRRAPTGEYRYETSLMGDRAVQFRDGVRLGRALKVNTDRLTYHAKQELHHGRLEEAQELYERAIEIDPYDGRSYLGLSRIAQRRRDYALARQCLRSGIANSVSVDDQSGQPDRGANPFLLQALGVLEEKVGHLSEAEALYISAVKSRPHHSAAWVALAQLRTRKLRQSASAGRVCYQTAERELKRAGKPVSAHVYTAWASMEYKQAGDTRRARELFQAALEIDPRCSAAYLQYGVMEADKENWDVAANLFRTALKNDKRNSRILQAYAILETKDPNGSSRKAIDLFEKARKANPRDAGVLQAYALFVAELGDIEAARNL